jgi:uncharacterized protein (TIGR02145 family)
MMLRFLPLLMLPLVGFAQTNSNVEMPMDATTTSEKQPLEIKRNAQYNLEEIKVRWKKAALENCAGAPCIVAPSFTCGTTTISDIDGNSYNTVLIGTQCWTQTNLKVTKYNDGTDIPDETGNIYGIPFLSTGARVVYGTYDNTSMAILPLSGYVGTYGYLYNWYAATNTKKICPAGWHVPSEDEWNTLRTQYGGQLVAGGKLKSTSNLWTSQSAGTDNSSGFSALPGGFRGSANSEFIGTQANFWGSTTNTGNPSQAISSYLPAIVDYFYIVSDQKYRAYSIRCLKD